MTNSTWMEGLGWMLPQKRLHRYSDNPDIINFVNSVKTQPGGSKNSVFCHLGYAGKQKVLEHYGTSKPPASSVPKFKDEFCAAPKSPKQNP